MAIQNPTPVQAARAFGFQANLRARGRAMTTDQGDTLTAIVQDLQPLPDLEHTAQAKKTIYVQIHAAANAVANPRAVQTFTEAGGRNYAVIRYDETVADAVTWSWFCEAQRQD